MQQKICGEPIRYLPKITIITSYLDKNTNEKEEKNMNESSEKNQTPLMNSS